MTDKIDAMKTIVLADLKRAVKEGVITKAEARAVLNFLREK